MSPGVLDAGVALERRLDRGRRLARRRWSQDRARRPATTANAAVGTTSPRPQRSSRSASDPNEPSTVLLGEIFVKLVSSEERSDHHSEDVGQRDDHNEVERQPQPVRNDLPNEDEVRQQLADVQNRQQRVGGAREVPFLLAVHADPERRDDDPGEQHAFPLVQLSEGRHRNVRAHCRPARPDIRAADLSSRTGH